MKPVRLSVRELLSIILILAWLLSIVVSLILGYRDLWRAFAALF